MSLANYIPVVINKDLNDVTYANTIIPVPDETPLYYMKPVGTLAQMKINSAGSSIYNGFDNDFLGKANKVQLYYDARGYMTIPEKQMLVEIGRKGPGGTKNNPTIPLPPDIQRYIGSFGGKRKTKSNRTNKRRKTKRR